MKIENTINHLNMALGLLPGLLAVIIAMTLMVMGITVGGLLFFVRRY